MTRGDEAALIRIGFIIEAGAGASVGAGGGGAGAP